MKIFFKKNWKDIFTVTIAILSLLISVYSYRQVSLDRINQVSIDLKNNRVFSDMHNIQYDVTVHNGSDLTIYNVTVIAPEDIKSMHDGVFSFDENEKPRGIYLGDIAPKSSITRSFLLENSREAQLNDFEMEFMSIVNFPYEKRIWWNKEVGNPPKKLNIKESEYQKIIGITTIESSKE